MKMKYFITGLIVFFVGAIVCLYPIIQDKYTDYRQKKMVDEVRNEIYEQIMNDNHKTDEGTDDKEEGEDKGNDDAESKNDFEEMELEQEDTKVDYVESKDKNLKGQKIIGIVEIDKLEVVYPIVEGTKKNNLHVAIGHMVKTAGIGETGNCVIAGHRGGALGTFFKNVHLLRNGDIIELTDLNGRIHEYEVYDSFIVEPTQMEVTYNNDPYDRTVTLITCEDNGTKRLIIKGKYVE